MKKDVIYIDTEDDITSIIDKVKHASAGIVALVPPKRVGVLQSTVNLKLLQRSAELVKKQIVLVTNDHALMSLASTLSLPIAKNLQSKPEVAPLSALAIDDDGVIDGSELPIGELAETGAASESATGVVVAAKSESVLPDIEEPVTPKEPTKVKTRIPDFDSFRRKLFLFGGLGILLVAFLVWALLFAGQATIAITAKTNLVNISKTLTLKPDIARDVNQGVLPVISKQVKKTNSVDFEPTGQKQVGEKSTGTVEFKPSANSVIIDGATIPSGTKLTSGSCNFTTVGAAVIQPTSLSDYLAGNLSSASISIIAVEPGIACNDLSGAVTGEPGGTDARIVGSTSGGTEKIAKVVTADDITKATEKLQSQDANVIKDELSKQFASDDIVIREAYVVDAGAATSTPAVDQEATTAKITQETTYTLLAVKRADLKAVYDEFLNTQLKGDTSQKVYKSGDEDTQFAGFQKTQDGYTVQAVGAAQVGPNIDANKIAENAKGKRKGEVQQSISSIQGVERVDVSLSPFWVSRVPDDIKRISVSFVINND